MESNFNRIKKGKQLDLNKNPYNVDFIHKMIDYFEESEEYEKCNTLLNFKKRMLDHENNYQLVKSNK